MQETETPAEAEGPVVEGPENWLSRAMRAHPEVLALRERLRPLSGHAPRPVETPSYGRDHRHAARTEVPEVLSPAVTLQLVLQYLHEEGLVQARDALIAEAKTVYPQLLQAMGITEAQLGGESPYTFSDTSLDPVFQRALLPLLHLGIRDLGGMFGPLPADEDEDPEVEAHEEYPGEGDVEGDEEQQEDVNVWDEPKQEGTNSLWKTDGGSGQQLIAGTVNQLVAWLTDPLNQDRAFMSNFLLTHPLFMTSEKLVAKLIQRCHVPRGRGDEKESAVLALTVLRVWAEKYPRDIVGAVSDQLAHFTKTMAEKETSVQFKQLQAALSKLDDVERKGRPGADAAASAAASAAAEDEDLPRPQVPTEPPVVPKNIFSPKLTLEDVEEAEIARQICLIDFRHYYKIQGRELVACAWKREAAKAPNVLAMVKRSSELSTWAMYCVLQGRWIEGAAPDRLRMFGKFLRIAFHLLKYCDFFAASALFGSLSTSAVQRVVRAAGAGVLGGNPSVTNPSGSRRGIPSGPISAGGTGLGPELNAMIVELTNAFSPDQNFGAYRRTYHLTKSACVPSLLILLRDITLVEEGMPDKLNGLINFHKRHVNAKLVSEFMSHRETVYPLQQVDQITALLKDFELPDEKALFELALNVQRE